MSSRQPLGIRSFLWGLANVATFGTAAVVHGTLTTGHTLKMIKKERELPNEHEWGSGRMEMPLADSIGPLTNYIAHLNSEIAQLRNTAASPDPVQAAAAVSDLKKKEAELKTKTAELKANKAELLRREKVPDLRQLFGLPTRTVEAADTAHSMELGDFDRVKQYDPKMTVDITGVLRAKNPMNTQLTKLPAKEQQKEFDKLTFPAIVPGDPDQVMKDILAKPVAPGAVDAQKDAAQKLLGILEASYDNVKPLKDLKAELDGDLTRMETLIMKHGLQASYSSMQATWAKFSAKLEQAQQNEIAEFERVPDNMAQLKAASGKTTPSTHDDVVALFKNKHTTEKQKLDADFSFLTNRQHQHDQTGLEKSLLSRAHLARILANQSEGALAMAREKMKNTPPPTANPDELVVGIDVARTSLSIDDFDILQTELGTKMTRDKSSKDNSWSISVRPDVSDFQANADIGDLVSTIIALDKNFGPESKINFKCSKSKSSDTGVRAEELAVMCYRNARMQGYAADKITFSDVAPSAAAKAEIEQEVQAQLSGRSQYANSKVCEEATTKFKSEMGTITGSAPASPAPAFSGSGLDLS